jgi:hypothetical protein
MIVLQLRSRGVAPLLTRVVLADRDSREARHIVISLTEGGSCRQRPQDTGVEMHCLGLTTPLQVPGALIRLTNLMRKIRPDVVMTWLHQAHFLGTLAAIASGVGASRVVWNVSGSSLNAFDQHRATRLVLRLLAVLSPFPWAIAAGSRAGRRAHEMPPLPILSQAT